MKNVGKKRLSNGAKIGIVVAVILTILVGWVVYAAIVSNVIEECLPINNYCEGVFPFREDESMMGTGCHKLEDGRQICF